MHKRSLPEEDDDIKISALSSPRNIWVVTWERVKEETAKDPTMQKLIFFSIQNLPPDKSDLPPDIAP